MFVDGDVSAGCFVQVQGDTWGGAGPGGWHLVGLRRESVSLKKQVALSYY